MPRALILFLLGLGWLSGAFAQSGGEVPVWTLEGPTGPVHPGQSFTVTARVQLPGSYYQDAESPFLIFEALAPLQTIGRGSSPASVRQGKPSFTGTFTLDRTITIPEAMAPGSQDLRFTIGWQICQLNGVCLLPVERTRTLPIVVVASPGGPTWGPSSEFWLALWGAFVGGLLLNLMPCVFPVLALKTVGLVGTGRVAATRRKQALAFAGGSFFTITALGLATAVVTLWGQRLDWGFPFQQPAFVWILTLMFWAFSLQLLGVWTWSWSPFSMTQSPQGSGTFKAFAGGAFLVLAAAPCTAPVLGPALGFALARPALEIPLFFLAMGAGLAAPLWVLQVFPGWSRWLPKPGPWMVGVERVAGVVLMASVGYLFWVFTVQTGARGVGLGLGLLAAMAGGLFVLGRFRSGGKKTFLTVVLGLGLLTGSVLLIQAKSSPPLESGTNQSGWKAYSAATLEGALRTGKSVLIDGTAAWCATCQVNEVAVLNRPEVRRILDDWGVVCLRADYTSPSPEIQRWLVSVQRAGLPVYALYRPGRPVYLFPELLTDENFTQSLPRLLASSSQGAP